MFSEFYDLINDTIRQAEEEIEITLAQKEAEEHGIQYARLDGLLSGLQLNIERLNLLSDLFEVEYKRFSEGKPREEDEEEFS